MAEDSTPPKEPPEGNKPPEENKTPEGKKPQEPTGSSLFRKEAIEAKRTGRLEELMIVINPKGWTALLSFFSLILVIIIWSFIGVIPTDVAGTSIVINHGNNFTLESVESGQVTEIRVQEGEMVKEGQLLAVIQSPKVDLNLENAWFQRGLIEKQMENYGAYYDQKTDAEIKALHESITSDEWEIYRIETELNYLHQELEWKKELLSEGLIALPQINEAREKINEKENAIDRARTSILQNKAKLKQLGDILQFQKYHNEIEKVHDQISDLELTKERLRLKSPFHGRVLTVPVNLKEEVEKGQTIIWLEHNGEKNQILYGYFRSKKDQQIKPGMIGQVRLNNVDYKRYGDLVVKAVRVWKFPVSSAEIYKTIGNHQLVNYLTKDGADAPVQVLFEPVHDKSTPSGYKWTSEKGPPHEVQTGSIGEIKVVIEEKRPIDYVFPIFRSIKNSLTFSRYDK